MVYVVKNRSFNFITSNLLHSTEMAEVLITDTMILLNILKLTFLSATSVIKKSHQETSEFSKEISEIYSTDKEIQ